MAIDTTDDVLTDRAQRLLKVLIESYIRDGQPVGSRTLSRLLSTMREELGTSAGDLLGDAS